MKRRLNGIEVIRDLQVQEKERCVNIPDDNKVQICRNGIKMLRIKKLSPEFWKIHKVEVEAAKIYYK